MGKNIIEIKSKNGTVYLYEDKSYWDKEKGYSTHERTCIGKKGADGNPIYNKYYKTREEIQGLAAEVEKANEVSSTTFVGETLVLDLGGSSMMVVTDNLKGSVVKADRYEPELNRIMDDFANHYGFAVIPAHVKKPRTRRPSRTR